jgi:hypothetical protein
MELDAAYQAARIQLLDDRFVRFAAVDASPHLRSERGQPSFPSGSFWDPSRPNPHVDGRIVLYGQQDDVLLCHERFSECRTAQL